MIRFKLPPVMGKWASYTACLNFNSLTLSMWNRVSTSWGYCEDAKGQYALIIPPNPIMEQLASARLTFTLLMEHSPLYFLTPHSRPILLLGLHPCAHLAEFISMAAARLKLQGLLVSRQQPSFHFLERISLSRSQFPHLYSAKCRPKQF